MPDVTGWPCYSNCTQIPQGLRNILPHWRAQPWSSWCWKAVVRAISLLQDGGKDGPEKEQSVIDAAAWYLYLFLFTRFSHMATPSREARKYDTYWIAQQYILFL